MKQPKYGYKEIKLRLWGYGLYLGAITHTKGKKQYRWHPHFKIKKLINAGGASFWDKKYWQ